MSTGQQRGQLRPLMRLRWQMVRSRRKQVLLVVVALAVAVLALGFLSAVSQASLRFGQLDLRTQALVAYPAALLLFLVVATLAPFLAGGAIELIPPAQLSAFPVAARTRFVLSLLLMPLNITWTLQVILLAALVVVGVGGTAQLAPLAGVTLAFVLAGTVVGQSLAWLGTTVRQTRPGRLATNLAAGALAVLVLTRANQETLFNLGDLTIFIPILDVGLSPIGLRWVAAVLALGLAAVLAGALGIRAVAWNQRLATETQGRHEGSRMGRRPQPGSELWAHVVVLSRSVWRSLPLRRGMVMLVALPVLVAAVTELQWTQIVVMPALVAAGAALLFGVNSTALLGGGAAWLGSLPYRPTSFVTAVAVVVATVIGGAATATTVGVAAFAPSSPTTAEAVALVAAGLSSAAWMTATAVRQSIRRPFQADLRGNRDTPAPPGVMAGYSLRLAGAAGVLGLLLAATAQLQAVRAAAVVGTIVLMMALARLALSVRAWRRPEVRSRVFMTVAFG